MTRRYYSSVAVATTIPGGTTNVATSIVIAAATGLPASYPYTMIIDDDTTTMEAVEVTNRSGTTLTVTRGVDGTTAQSHATNAPIHHGWSARDLDEPNAWINAGHDHSTTALGGAVPQASVTNLTTDLAAKVASTIVDAKGDLIVATAADTVSRLAVGTNGQALVADSTAGTGLKWGNAGSVLQVVSSALSTRFTTSSHTAVDIGLSATITLGSASNKVLVCTSLICGGPAAEWVAEFTRLRNGSSYGPQGRFGWLWAGGHTRPESLTSMYLDSPASTSALTYKVQVQSEFSNEVVINGRGYDTMLFGESTLTLMEIAA